MNNLVDFNFHNRNHFNTKHISIRYKIISFTVMISNIWRVSFLSGNLFMFFFGISTSRKYQTAMENLIYKYIFFFLKLIDDLSSDLIYVSNLFSSSQIQSLFMRFLLFFSTKRLWFNFAVNFQQIRTIFFNCLCFNLALYFF